MNQNREKSSGRICLALDASFSPSLHIEEKHQYQNSRLVAEVNLATDI